MKIEVGQIWRARNGRLWRIVCVDAKGIRPIVAVQHTPDDDGSYSSPRTFTPDGFYWQKINESSYDLIAEHREPMKRDWWLVRFANGDEMVANSYENAAEVLGIADGTIHRGTWTEELP